jgi:uncharacterized repeat protein (TIGR01451 family)
VNAVPTPTSVAGNVITWDLPALGSFGAYQVSVGLVVPPGTPLGTLLNSSFSVSNTLTEASMANNTISITTTVIGSFDPNMKEARTSTGLNNTYYYIDQDEWIDYTIRFQNTGTAAASFVVITDTLSTDLDMLTFEQGTASHPFDVSFKPDRVVEWGFDNINLPDSASDEPGSHGLVNFRIRPVQPLLAGTVIENTANIFFDFNPPVITEPSVLTAEFSTGAQGQEQGQGQMLLLPNPASDDLLLRVADGAIEVITIIAADGREVMRQWLRSSNSTIDVSGLPAGSYFLFATTSNGSVVRERFTKL